MPKFNNVMLDLETLSTRSDACIIQIAAIAFDIETGELGPRFNAYVNEPDAALRGYVDTDTIAWWLQQRVASAMGVRLQPSSGALPLSDALTRFADWVRGLGCAFNDLRVWAHGASFDVPILLSAYSRAGREAPFRYRAPRDTRTLYEAAGMGEGQRRAPDPEREHDAQYDCEYQIAQVVEAYAALREQSDHAALYLGRIGDLSGERALCAGTAQNPTVVG
jgi:3'-5' exoribonuclease-like protein